MSSKTAQAAFEEALKAYQTATYGTIDQLRQAAQNLREATAALSAAPTLKASVLCDICGQETDEPVDFMEHHLCPTCHRRVSDYASKMEDRADRLHERAQKATAEAHADSDRAHKMADAIPFGQPILVGHHSERRDRNYRDRIWNLQGRAYQKFEKAARLEQRAHAADKNRAISSDNPAAILLLEQKLTKLVTEQSEMVRLNKLARKVIGMPVKYQPTDHHGTVEEINARFRAERERVQAIQAGYVTKAAELSELASISLKLATSLLTPDQMGRVGIPDYALKNNGAEIRRLQKRISELKGKAARQATEPALQDEEIGDIRIERNAEDNRLRIHFPAKPSAAVIAKLKYHGFKWSPANKAWQRQLNHAAEHAAQWVIEFIQQQEK